MKERLKVLDEASKTFPKGIHYVNLINVNDFLDASIEKVIHTLIEAFVLVFIVVFVFLQDLRSTLIPAIAVPVAIIGTFFFLSLFGFTINLLTLFALVLAIGIVVDDAIVVVEAVHAKLDKGYTSARKATIDAMGEIIGRHHFHYLGNGGGIYTGKFYYRFGGCFLQTIWINTGHCYYSYLL